VKVGILDVLATPALGWAETLYDLFLTRAYACITPQAIAVWCRRLGHETSYATYFGVGDPKRRLPSDLDVVFISTYTQPSALAYALAKLYRREGTLTVVGGAHAKAFPHDCLRFFDVVVKECDRTLVADIVRGDVGPGTIVSSARPFDDVPSVEERMPEIRASAFVGGRPFFASMVPLLASVGCPYACDFCVDWNTPYRLLPVDRLAEDLRYLAREMPGTLAAFYDPNFGVKFDRVLDVMESVPGGIRTPYLVDSSLSVVKGPRAARLGRTGCGLVASGIESWSDYSNKAGVGRTTGAAKVARVAEQFRELHEHVPYLQAQLMFGLDGDRGDEPIELMKDFMDRTPFVWPVVNIPHPFGNTPLYDRYRKEGRILSAMPFAFYYSPYLVTTLEGYDPITYYEKLADVLAFLTSPAMLRRRLATAPRRMVAAGHRVRTWYKRARRRAFERIARLLRSDRRMLEFHEGRPRGLPDFYQREYERLLGRYAELMSKADRTPVLEPAEWSVA
jgi:radical SAM superfamily enzyme YgiQ (UPF0313 family)